MSTSVQIGLDPKALRKLQSCFVAAEAACSNGDLPVVAVDTRLAAVVGLATATVAAAVPAELAAAVEALPIAMSGAAQPVRLRHKSKPPRMLLRCKKKADHPDRFGLLRRAAKTLSLFALANNVKDSSCPRFTDNRFEFTIGRFVV